MAQYTLVFCTVFFANTVVCCVPWGCAEATSLGVSASVSYMPVLVAFEALRNHAVPLKWLAIVEFVLPYQASVYQAGCLL